MCRVFIFAFFDNLDKLQAKCYQNIENCVIVRKSHVSTVSGHIFVCGGVFLVLRIVFENYFCYCNYFACICNCFAVYL